MTGRCVCVCTSPTRAARPFNLLTFGFDTPFPVTFTHHLAKSPKTIPILTVSGGQNLEGFRIHGVVVCLRFAICLADC